MLPAKLVHADVFPLPSLLVQWWLFTALLCALLFQVGADDYEKGHAELVKGVTSDKAMTIHWVGQNLYGKEAFKATYSSQPGCPEAGVPIANIYCGDSQLHPHWPHSVETIYGCWHWWRKTPSAGKVVFNQYPNLAAAWYQHLEILNVSQMKSAPLGCNDLQVQANPALRRSGWHHEEGGANFMSVEDANAYRNWVLQSLEHSGRAPRTARKKGQHTRTLSKAFPHIKIGILNRRGPTNSRRIVNPELIYGAFAHHFASSQIHTLDDMSDLPDVRDQLLWVNTMDIIVTGHGAQLVNLVAAAPCTVVVEIFSPQYFIPGFFGPMANALGLKVFGMYMGKDGYADTDPCRVDEVNCAREARLRQITVPEEFLKLPPVLLKAREECCAQIHCW